jgi:hypothetical protein
LAFLIGAAIVPFALRLRRTLVETLTPASTADNGLAGWPLLLVSAAGLFVIAGATISNYTLEYLTTYA